MEYVRRLSLKNMALSTIAITLWNNADVDYILRSVPKPWQSLKYVTGLEITVDDNVKKLPLPDSLKLILSEVIGGMAWQIRLCLSDFDMQGETYLDFKWLCWTPQLTVDRQKTAENIIKKENMNIYKQFSLACVNCLESEIRSLWETFKEHYSENSAQFETSHFLVIFWPLYIQGEQAQLNALATREGLGSTDPIKVAFLHAVNNGNEPATKYFIAKLNPAEREDMLIETINRLIKSRSDTIVFSNYKRCNFATVLCALLSHLNEKKQAEIFKELVFEILICLVELPWKESFIETAQKWWDFLSKEDYNFLLWNIAINAKLNFNRVYYDYLQLFRQFWHKSPNSFKNYVIKQFETERGLLNLFIVENEDCIKTIFNYLSPEDKKNIFKLSGMQTCKDLIDSDEHLFTKLFIEECRLTKDEMMEYRNDFIKYFENANFEESKQEIFFSIWDECMMNCDERDNLIQNERTETEIIMRARKENLIDKCRNMKLMTKLNEPIPFAIDDLRYPRSSS